MKRIAAVFLSLVMTLTACAALAKVPDQPKTFAYAYDFDGTVLDSADIAAIEEFGHRRNWQRAGKRNGRTGDRRGGRFP